jgi:uncharacterized membrane protein
MNRGERFDRLDALRGIAIVWMAAYHFAFDLNYYGLLQPRQNFYADPLWTVQRTLIVSLFLTAVGAGQAIAVERGQPWRRFWKRWAQVAGCAVLVSIGSWFMFPRSWISFGVLHGIALMLIALRAGAGLGRWWFLLGPVAIMLPHVVGHPFFDTRLTNWVGLVTRKPVTEDYVPLLPWIGVAGIAFAAARELLGSPGRAWLSGPLPLAQQPLALLGRWPLTFYMLHQPVLIGLVLAWLALSR